MADIDLPKLAVFTVREREGQRPTWIRIGTAYRHALGEGFNVKLDALPVDGKLVLMPPKKNESKDNAG